MAIINSFGKTKEYLETEKCKGVAVLLLYYISFSSIARLNIGSHTNYCAHISKSKNINYYYFY